MLTRLKNARVYDPVQKLNGELMDLWIRDDRIVDPSQLTDRESAITYDLDGAITIAGGVDIHSHIAGGNVNTARLLLPDQHRNHPQRQENLPFYNAR